jgi:hypothetical protein
MFGGVTASKLAGVVQVGVGGMVGWLGWQGFNTATQGSVRLLSVLWQTLAERLRARDALV